MKSFTDRWRQLEWDDIRLRINSKTAADVARALNASHLNREDMMALLSPPPLITWSRWRSARKSLPASVSAIPSAFMFRSISRTCAPMTVPTAVFR
ncbi:thiamine biosynthesis protein ThiH [Salmonella enterica subsp. diarizonae]|uniref:Thiamine biosynthesis protein ThiH n=1 Tax=Salmonella diarizonae TaxID=59204 RepID=A0A379U8B0_SALDZ|nr:thiamine biosynthesis protein ThiH [Salmonella enterica subsp. diarizonae]